MFRESFILYKERSEHMESLQKTPLYSVYKDESTIVDFAGWALPLQFEGIAQEHVAVREKAGLFDVSHMGELEVKGKDAENFLQGMFTNDLSTLEVGKAIYGFFCMETGGVVDDLLIYKFSDTEFFLVTNAANAIKDYNWLKSHQESYEVEINDLGPSICQLALQGPKAEEILQNLTDMNLSTIPFLGFKRSVMIQGIPCIISRTGYTGEDGFEIFTDVKFGVDLWQLLIETGESYGLQPTGLGCRDTLRFEAGLPLYGHEISDEITPIEAGLGHFVKLNKASFIGKEVLAKQKTEGVERKLIGFELLGKGVPRQGYLIEKDGEHIGEVTTGYLSPTLKKSIGMALVKAEYSTIGTELQLVMRNKRVNAVVCNKRFYSK